MSWKKKVRRRPGPPGNRPAAGRQASKYLPEKAKSPLPVREGTEKVPVKTGELKE